jgi:dienelactone hydrolase
MPRLPRFAWTPWVAVALALAAFPARASEAVEALLLAAPSSTALRAALLDFVATAPDSAVAGKGAAWLYAGMSYARDGRADSALTCFERAVEVRGLAPERDACVDALMLRGREADMPRAREILGPRLQTALTNSEHDIALTRAREGWALYIEGKGDSALTRFRMVERWLLDAMNPHVRDWRYRMGLIELEHGDASKCIDLLFPLAIESRFQDRDVMGILRDASNKTGSSSQLAALAKQKLSTLDAEYQTLLDTLGGRRVTFTADDGYTLGGVAFAPRGRKPARALVAVMDQEEMFDAYDSLATGLARHGYAVLLLEPRGSGASVAPSCPLPDTWQGREAEMQTRVARDVRPALRALASSTGVDTARYVLLGSLTSAPIAVEALTLDARARPLVLLSPAPSPIEVGSTRARLVARRVPTFFEVPVMDHATLETTETLYEALDPRASRIVESEIIGSTARVFRRDVSALPRLLQWLDESWGSKSTGPAPRPAGKQKRP